MYSGNDIVVLVAPPADSLATEEVLVMPDIGGSNAGFAILSMSGDNRDVGGTEGTHSVLDCYTVN